MYWFGLRRHERTIGARIPNFKAINIAAGEAHSMAIDDTKEGSFIPGVSEVLVP